MTQDPYDTRQPSSAKDGKAPGIAIAAVVFGALSILLSPLFIFGIIALVLGLMAVGKTGEPSGRPGRGLAIAGVAMGGSSLLLGLVMALLIAILLPALGAARRTARQMQNSTQLRGIHQGMVTYANSNKNYMPGLAMNGEIWADGPETGNSGDGNTPQARMWMLMDGYFFTPEYAISPAETEAIYEYLGNGPVTQDNYSYAMLSFLKTGTANTDATGRQTYAVDPATQGRASEWLQTLNSHAIVISDRNTGSNATAAVDSIHSGSPGSWKGTVLWNDNHVAFEPTHIIQQTKYANGNFINNDNLFEDSSKGYDALMVWDKP